MVFSDLVGRKGEMLVAWSEHMQIKMMRSNDFCVKMQVALEGEKDSFWATFMHASTEAKERQRKWE